MQTSLSKKHERGKMATTVAFAVICIVYLLPILIVLMNSFKSNAAVNMETFALPNADSFVGFQNYVKGMTFGNYPFVKAVFYSLFITAGILGADFAVYLHGGVVRRPRGQSRSARSCTTCCVFSMVVPFQMVMFTLSRSRPTSCTWTRRGPSPVIYLGFGAGLAVFMFSGFVKSIPLEIEEAAVIDGCGPLRTFFLVVLPMLKPTFISVGVLEIMWVWNDYPAAVPGAGPHQVHDHPHRHPVPEGQLRSGGYGRYHGADPAEHPAGHRVLPAVPEAHHQGCGRRRRQGLKIMNNGAGISPAPRNSAYL